MRTLIAAIATTLALAGVARAETPQNYSAPEVTGRAAVGWGIVGHNGTWLYDDGTSCGPECAYAFAWERCDARGCNPIASATSRVYKVRAVDAGHRFRVIVTTTKYDCGEWNYAEGEAGVPLGDASCGVAADGSGSQAESQDKVKEEENAPRPVTTLAVRLELTWASEGDPRCYFGGSRARHVVPGAFPDSAENAMRMRTSTGFAGGRRGVGMWRTWFPSTVSAHPAPG